MCMCVCVCVCALLKQTAIWCAALCVCVLVRGAMYHAHTHAAKVPYAEKTMPKGGALQYPSITADHGPGSRNQPSFDVHVITPHFYTTFVHHNCTPPIGPSFLA